MLKSIHNQDFSKPLAKTLSKLSWRFFFSSLSLFLCFITSFRLVSLLRTSRNNFTSKNVVVSMNVQIVISNISNNKHNETKAKIKYGKLLLRKHSKWYLIYKNGYKDICFLHWDLWKKETKCALKNRNLIKKISCMLLKK